jgi:DNA repair exonuclease SbcCD nuclease subunit
MIADGLRLVASAGIPVVAVRGNHELLGLPKGHRGPLDRFADIAGVQVVSEPGVVKLDCGLAVACLPWPRRSEMDLDDEDDAGTADRAIVVADLADQVANLGAPSVLLGHATVAEARLGSARRGSEGLLAAALWEPLVSSELLDQGPWAAALLGHIHRRQRIGEKVYYCGSPDRVDFSEEGDEKAFSVVHVSGTEAVVEAVPTPARAFRTVRGDKGIPDDLAPGTVVRLLVADRSVEADARRAVEAAGAIVARVVVDAKPVSVVATSDDATELTPLDALEAWAQAQDLPEDLARSVLSLGRAIISGDER